LKNLPQEYLLYLLQAREMKLFTQLADKMGKAGKEGTFKTWMLEESDLIQAAARAYGERLVTER
jgi:acyl-CoA oxidase